MGGLDEGGAAPRRVLLADGVPSAALACARSLARGGWTVGATLHGRGCRAPRSRGVVGIRTPGPAEDPRGFASRVLELAREWSPCTVLPCSDAAVQALLPLRDALAALGRVVLPSPAVLETATDKGLTLSLARSIGLSTPATALVRSPEEAASCKLVPPLVLKPVASRWLDGSGRIDGSGPVFATGTGELEKLCARFRERGCPGVLVQEWVPGTGWGVGVLLRDGSVGGVFVHRRLREVHPAGGPSAAAMSEPPDPALVEPAIALLRAMKWEGIAMVEFRREGLGVPVLMEVNGRPWGTLGLAVDAGVDFPRLLLEGHAGPPPEYRVGMRRRWLAGDLRRVLAAWAGPPPGYPGPYPSTGAALRDLLFRGAPDFVFRWSDPLPFLAEFAGAFR